MKCSYKQNEVAFMLKIEKKYKCPDDFYILR